MLVCPGCGARNEPDARVCDWCGRPFVDEQRQITVPWLIPVTVGAITMLAVATIIAALLGARAAAPRGPDVASSTAVAAPIATEPAAESDAASAVAAEPEAAPSSVEYVRIANTGGVGAFIRRDPQQNAPGLVALRDGSVVRVVGADVTAAGRAWRNVEDQRGNRGWTPAEYLAPSETGF